MTNHTDKELDATAAHVKALAKHFVKPFSHSYLELSFL